MNMDIAYEDGFIEFLREIAEGNHLENTALGIVRQIIGTGELKSLSRKQLYVFENEVVDYYITSCARCGSAIPWSEMYNASQCETEMCAYCYHMNGKGSILDFLPI